MNFFEAAQLFAALAEDNLSFIIFCVASISTIGAMKYFDIYHYSLPDRNMNEPIFNFDLPKNSSFKTNPATVLMNTTSMVMTDLTIYQPPPTSPKSIWQIIFQDWSWEKLAAVIFEVDYLYHRALLCLPDNILPFIYLLIYAFGTWHIFRVSKKLIKTISWYCIGKHLQTWKRGSYRLSSVSGSTWKPLSNVLTSYWQMLAKAYRQKLNVEKAAHHKTALELTNTTVDLIAEKAAHEKATSKLASATEDLIAKKAAHEKAIHDLTAATITLAAEKEAHHKTALDLKTTKTKLTNISHDTLIQANRRYTEEISRLKVEVDILKRELQTLGEQKFKQDAVDDKLNKLTFENTRYLKEIQRLKGDVKIANSNFSKAQQHIKSLEKQAEGLQKFISSEDKPPKDNPPKGNPPKGNPPKDNPPKDNPPKDNPQNGNDPSGKSAKQSTPKGSTPGGDLPKDSSVEASPAKNQSAKYNSRQLPVVLPEVPEILAFGSQKSRPFTLSMNASSAAAVSPGKMFGAMKSGKVASNATLTTAPKSAPSSAPAPAVILSDELFEPPVCPPAAGQQNVSVNPPPLLPEGGPRYVSRSDEIPDPSFKPNANEASRVDQYNRLVRAKYVKKHRKHVRPLDVPMFGRFANS